MNVVSDLVGAIVIVFRFDRYGDSRLGARGCVRAITAAPNGELILWIEELDEAERACWFGTDRGPPRDETPGRIVRVAIDEGRAQIDVVRQPRQEPPKT